MLGTSEKPWDDAAQEAVARPGESVDDVHGVGVEDRTVDVENGQ